VDTFLLGAYRKVAKDCRIVMSLITSRDYDVIGVTSQRQNAFL